MGKNSSTPLTNRDHNFIAICEEHIYGSLLKFHG